MNTKELAEFIKLLGMLPKDRQREFYMMIKGAVIVQENKAV